MKRYPLTAEDITELGRMVDKAIGEGIASAALAGNSEDGYDLKPMGELYALRSKLAAYPIGKANGPSITPKTRQRKPRSEERATEA